MLEIKTRRQIQKIEDPLSVNIYIDRQEPLESTTTEILGDMETDRFSFIKNRNYYKQQSMYNTKATLYYILRKRRLIYMLILLCEFPSPLFFLASNVYYLFIHSSWLQCLLKPLKIFLHHRIIFMKGRNTTTYCIEISPIHF